MYCKNTDNKSSESAITNLNTQLRNDESVSLKHWSTYSFLGISSFCSMIRCSSFLSMLYLRCLTSALIFRTGTQTLTVRLVPKPRSSPTHLRVPVRPISLSTCLCKKKKARLWLEMSDGQNMDGNIEEILAPLRLAVKEQVKRASQSTIIQIVHELAFQ